MYITFQSWPTLFLSNGGVQTAFCRASSKLGVVMCDSIAQMNWFWNGFLCRHMHYSSVTQKSFAFVLNRRAWSLRNWWHGKQSCCSSCLARKPAVVALCASFGAVETAKSERSYATFVSGRSFGMWYFPMSYIAVLSSLQAITWKLVVHRYISLNFDCGSVFMEISPCLLFCAGLIHETEIYFRQGQCHSANLSNASKWYGNWKKRRYWSRFFVWGPSRWETTITTRQTTERHSLCFVR